MHVSFRFWHIPPDVTSLDEPATPLPSIQVDWRPLLDQAFSSAQGMSALPVPGAKLRIALAQEARRHEVDLSEFLRTRGYSFSRFIEQFSGFTIIRRPGTDILIGRAGEETPVSAVAPASDPEGEEHGGEQRIIRKDLYGALTDFGSARQYYYNPSDDSVIVERGITNHPPSLNLVGLPRTSFDEQLDLRRRFAESIGSDPLRLALNSTQDALRRFQTEANALQLGTQWHDFKFTFLHERLVNWAATNRIQVRPEWFSPAVSRRDTDVGLAAFMRLLVDHMTEEELRQTTVSLRSVHALWLSHKRRSNQ
ncbi:MAG: hypothetical protein ACR2NO_06660 [Chloroflexota bacterium]